MAESGKKLIQNIISSAVKFLIAAAVIIWFFRNQGHDLLSEVDKFNFLVLLPALLLTLLSTWVSAIRWRDLAESSGISLTPGKAFSLTMQGMFFSLVIPGGAIGGDVVKMAALSAHIRPGTRTEGFFSILMDRLVGMLALFLIAPVLLCCSRYLFTNIEIDGLPWLNGTVLWWLLMGISLAGLGAGGAVLMHHWLEKIPGVKPLMDFLDRRSKGKVTRILAAADRCSARKGRLIYWVVLTVILVHLLPAAGMYILLSGAGIAGAVVPVMTAVVMGNIAGLIPIFPGGIGGRDVVTVALLAAGGYPAESAAAAQLFSTALMIVFNLSGAVFFICDRKNSGNIK